MKISGRTRSARTVHAIVYLVILLQIIQPARAYCPVVICPGFGNDAIDYDTPLEQPSTVGLKSVLSRRGFDMDQIYTVPVQRSDWIRVAGGLLDIPGFYTGNAQPTGLGYGWYIERLKKEVDRAYEESGGQKVILMGHSAGGWLARAALGDGTWSQSESDNQSENENEELNTILTSERVACLVTMGAIHKTPSEESTCVTRGALKNTDAQFPGAYLKDQGVKYVSIGGAAIEGEMTDRSVKELRSKAKRIAYDSYEAVSGVGDQTGDGVVPFEWTQLDGSRKIRLDGVLHSINEAGTTMPTDRWYGSEGVVDRWLPDVLEELDLGKNNNNNKNSNAFSSFKVPNWMQNLSSNFMEKGEKEDQSPTEARVDAAAEEATRRSALKSILTTSSTAVATLLLSPPPSWAKSVDSNIIVLPSGVSSQDLRVGDGDEVTEGKRVNIQWVLKRSNGNVMDASSNNAGIPFIFTVGRGKGDTKSNTDSGVASASTSRAIQRAIVGLDEGIRGMKVGGIRRVVIPTSLAYVEGLGDGMPGPIPGGFSSKERIRIVMENRVDVPDENFMIDVQATRVQ